MKDAQREGKGRVMKKKTVISGLEKTERAKGEKTR